MSDEFTQNDLFDWMSNTLAAVGVVQRAKHNGNMRVAMRASEAEFAALRFACAGKPPAWAIRNTILRAARLITEDKPDYSHLPKEYTE